MMRKLFVLGTALFWLALAVIWFAGHGPQQAGEASAPMAEKRFALDAVAAHAGQESCWMAIDGGVYDLTAYLPEHPTRPSIILPWCGKEASVAYRTKNKGRKHSAEADRRLAAYRIGALADAPTPPPQ